jgi:aspartate aminotransferase
MFSLLPISNEGVMSLRKENAIYLMPDGRINIASLPEDNIEYITSSICNLREFQSRKN